MHFRMNKCIFINVILQINDTLSKDTVPHLFCFLEWSTIDVIIIISAIAPMTEPATIPVMLPEK